jgi:mRNA interferase MazF
MRARFVPERCGWLAKTVEMTITVPETLFAQVEILSQHANITSDRLFEMAIETYVGNFQKRNQNESKVTLSGEQSVINQGDIYWVQLEHSSDSESNIPHPYVVIQANIFNQSRVHTVVASAVTSNRRRANLPGNVFIDIGEATLPKRSIVEVSKISTLDKSQLGEYIGTLSQQRVSQILAGIQFLQSAFFAR